MNAVLEIQLFGGFALSYDGEALPPLPSRHARLLFAWLVLHGGRPQARPLLCDVLWPDAPEARARRRLSHALWQVQDCFGERAPDQPYLRTQGDQVVFDTDRPYRLDVEEFEQRLDDVDRAGDVDDPTLRTLRRAVELYQGDLLAGSYESWVVREQDRLLQRYVNALARLVEASKERGNYDEALTLARRLTHQAPLREDAHREVMRLSVLLGQPSVALEQFERCRSVLEEELGTEPSSATLALYDQILQSRSAASVPATPVQELATDRLVGRDDERVRLVDQLERTLRGTAGAVFVEGEPGVGKTQLLAQAVDDASWRGFTVLWGTCRDRTLPYGVLREAVLPALDPVRVAQLGTLVEPVWRREAARLLPPLAESGGADPRPGGDLDGADAAQRMRQALAAILTGLASLDPVVLVLEDLHLADAETLELLRTLGRHPDPGRLLVLTSFRDADARADADVWTALRALDRDARPVRVALGPLTTFETGALLADVLGTRRVPAPFTRAVHRECGGNPLYVLELLRSLRDTGALDSGGLERLDTLDVPVTADLRSLIAGRLELLSADAAAVAELAAVLGHDGALDTLRVGSGLDRRELAATFGELARRNLLRVGDDRYHFTHAATRTVLLDGCDEEHVRTLHRTAAEALEATDPEAVENLAAHLCAAELPDRALPYLLWAAQRAVGLHAHTSAAAHLETALTLCERTPVDVALRTELLLLAEGVFDVLGRRDRQAAALEELHELAGSDVELMVEVQLRRATHLGHVDRLGEAVEVARAAVDAADDPVQRGRSLVALGRVLGWAGENEDAVGVLREAVELLAEEPEQLVAARSVLATALRFLQRFDDAEHELTEALASAARTGEDVGAVLAVGALADLHAETGRTDRAVELYDTAVDRARELGFRHREGVGLVNLATVRLTRGEIGPSARAYDDAEAVFTALGNQRGIAMVRLNRAWLHHRWLGDDERATEDATAALQYLSQIGSHGLAAVAHETLAGIARRRGATEEAGDHIAQGLGSALAVHDRRAAVQLHRGQVELLLTRGEAATALTLAQRTVEEAADLDLPEFVSDLAAAAALASCAGADVDPAITTPLVTLATDHLATSAEPHRVHHRLGLVAEAGGDSEGAARHHRRAHELLRSALDGVPDAAADRALRDVPVHAAIVEAGLVHTPRRVTLELARSDAPRGRALAGDDTTAVELELAPSTGTAEERRAALLDVLEQVGAQDARATVEDLTLLFDVSASTVRRDLRSLRAAGHEVTTRGSHTG